MQIYEALEKDHKALKSLLKDLVATQVGSIGRSRVVEAIKDELIPHARAEEAVFYNALREIKSLELKELVMGHGYGEHIEAENMLIALVENNSEKEDLAEDFKTALEHHIEEEEDEMFSAARKVLLTQEAENCGELFEELKKVIKQQGDEQNIQELVMNMLPNKFGNPHHL